MPSVAGKVATGPGARLWLSRFAGPGHAGGKASAVAVSPAGTTVFVTGTFGWSGLPTPHEDYGTVGYDAATGKQLWASRYDGIGGPDLATAIAVSPDARTVFVTGESDGPPKDNGKANAYATVAYDAATGKQLWASRYDGHGTFDNFDFARAIAVSPDGRTVFVTGEASAKRFVGYTTIAYSAAAGKQKWARNYDSPGGWANALAVSPDGRTLFVTGDVRRKPAGVDGGTIAYDARTGAQRWVSFYAGSAGNTDANAVQVSPDGRTVFVTGETGDHFATVAYSAANGAQRWVSRWQDTSGNWGVATAIAVSPGGGAVYVTGYSGTTDVSMRPQIVTVGYNARTGARQWVREYRAPGICRNIATSVAVGAGGSTVFVGGFSTIPEPKGKRPCDAGLDTIAYRAATGKQLWLTRVRAAVASGGGLAVSRLTDTVVITGGIYPRPRAGEQYATAAYRG
jgi:PQQ-like domain